MTSASFVHDKRAGRGVPVPGPDGGGTPVPVMAARNRSGPVSSPGGDSTIQEIGLAGAHGGAGVTTLAVLLQPACDMGAVPPTGLSGAPRRTGSRTRPPAPRRPRRTAAAAAATV